MALYAGTSVDSLRGRADAVEIARGIGRDIWTSRDIPAHSGMRRSRRVARPAYPPATHR